MKFLKTIRHQWFPLMVLLIPALFVSVLAQNAADNNANDRASTSQEQEELTMNFRNVDIRQIIESVGEVTGKNFLIDPRVRAKVTIIANEPVPRTALYDVLLSILRMHGYRAIENIGITRVVPANLGARYARNNTAEGLVTEIINIKHLNSASVIPLIKPLMTPQAQVLNHKETNNLIISETEANLKRAKGILNRLDVPSIASYDIVPLQYFDATDMQKILQKVSNKNIRHLVSVIADQGANRMIITGPEELRLRLRLLIADMDTPAASSHLSGSIQIISLHYAKAEDIATLLKNLFSSSAFLKNLGGQGSVGSNAPVAPTPKAGGKKKAPKPKPTAKASRRKEDSRNYTIQFEEETNSIIVGGPPKIIQAAQYIIKKLDVPRPQVLIEAIVADISDDQMTALRTQLNGLVSFNSDGSARVDPTAIIPEANYKGVLAGLSGGNSAIGGQIGTGGVSINYLIQALRGDSNTNVLSTPSILTLNNQEAMIDVSDTRYVQTGTNNNSAGITTARSKEEFGTLLKVTPQITEGKAVKLEIEQRTEDITNDVTANNEYPQTRKRELKTSVVVNNGDILVLGGLIQNRRQETKTGIPFLSDIPFIGRLFGNSSSNNEADTLMIFIRPTILRNPTESSDFSKEVYARIRLEQLLYGEEINSLLKDSDIKDQAILPPVEGERTMTLMPKKTAKASEDDKSTKVVKAGGSLEAAPAQPKRRIIRRVIRRRVVDGDG